MKPTEDQILQLLSKDHIVRKSELIKGLEATNPKREVIKDTLVSLQREGLVSIISPMGEESYTLTRDGIRLVHGMKK